MIVCDVFEDLGKGYTFLNECHVHKYCRYMRLSIITFNHIRNPTFPNPSIETNMGATKKNKNNNNIISTLRGQAIPKLEWSWASNSLSLNAGSPLLFWSTCKEKNVTKTSDHPSMANPFNFIRVNRVNTRCRFVWTLPWIFQKGTPNTEILMSSANGSSPIYPSGASCSSRGQRKVLAARRLA